MKELWDVQRIKWYFGGVASKVALAISNAPKTTPKGTQVLASSGPKAGKETPGELVCPI